MSSTYFGLCNSDGSLSITPISGGPSNTLAWNVGAVYTCPGSGNQQITDIGVYVANTAGVSARLAIYTTDLTTILAYTALKDCNLGSNGWLVWTAAELTLNNLLVGGVNYCLCVAYSGATSFYTPMYRLISSKCQYKGGTDYVTGNPAFPSPIPTATGDYGAETAIRVGVIDEVILPTIRLTQESIEVLTGIPKARLSQESLEVLTGTPSARLSQESLEVLTGNPRALVSQVAVEVLVSIVPIVTQIPIEVLVSNTPDTDDSETLYFRRHLQDVRRNQE